jgi:hypothetical protein
MNQTKRIGAVALGLAFALLPAVLLAGISADKPEPDSSTVSHESPFACDRLALDAEARRRHFEELGPALRVLREGVRELPDGFEFRFPSDPKTIAMVAEWAVGERLCCPFFDIQLRMEREGGPFWMKFADEKGSRSLLRPTQRHG